MSHDHKGFQGSQRGQATHSNTIDIQADGVWCTATMSRGPAKKKGPVTRTGPEGVLGGNAQKGKVTLDLQELRSDLQCCNAACKKRMWLGTAVRPLLTREGGGRLEQDAQDAPGAFQGEAIDHV